MSITSPSYTMARTKIVATVGPACRNRQKLTELVLAGVDVFRLNMAHADRGTHEESVATIRSISEELKRPIAILADLAGPKIRLGELPGGQLELTPGLEVAFIRGEHSTSPLELTTTYEPLVSELKVGNLVMLADGTVSLTVEKKSADRAVCRVVQPGLIRSRQGLNLPGVKLSAPAMDVDDVENAIWASKAGIDFLGLSFVRAADDVLFLKNLLKSHSSRARVIAKIEKQEALDQLEAIVMAADGIMVARGDLGVEIDVAKMPVVQKQIIATCQRFQKPVIIATQMLDSMHHSRRPTRAEVTDVANAILDGGDACMLSGETAIGDFPREAVEMMNKIALATEEVYRDRPLVPAGEVNAEGLHTITRAVIQGAGRIACELDARLMIVATHTGATSLAVGKQRCYVHTIGVSDSPETLRRMCLHWGVIPLPGAPTEAGGNVLEFVVDWARSKALVKQGDLVVMLFGAALGSGSHNQVAVHQVE